MIIRQPVFVLCLQDRRIGGLVGMDNGGKEVPEVAWGLKLLLHFPEQRGSS